MAGMERRRFLRHLLISPLKFKVSTKEHLKRSETLDASEGGLMFLSRQNVSSGTLINIEMPLYDKVFKVRAKVVHTEKDEEKGLFNIGVEFVTYADAFKVKLMEQIYLIEEYRVLRSLQVGKDVSIQEASREWIKRYSERFEKLYW